MNRSTSIVACLPSEAVTMYDDNDAPPSKTGGLHVTYAHPSRKRRLGWVPQEALQE